MSKSGNLDSWVDKLGFEVTSKVPADDGKLVTDILVSLFITVDNLDAVVNVGGAD